MPHYTISWTNPRHRLFDVTIRFTAADNDPLLWLPAWRPGRYLVQNYAANVREWSANLRKVGKSEWRAEANAGDEVTVSYRYYAAVLDAGSSFLDDDEAYVNGSNLLMCVDALRGEESRLTIAAPAEWRIETQLPRDEAFVARDYDHLIDSPIIAASEMTRHSFRVPRDPRSSSGSSGTALPRNSEDPEEPEDLVRIHLIVRGRGDYEPYVEPLRAIARAQAALFGGFPFRDYRFLVHVGDKWHGVEHEDSSSLIVKRFDDDHVLSLCSHELFHAWLVKRIVPAAFTPYDYLHETPTRLLWAMEGITSYYGDLMLARASVWSAEQYIEHLRKEIEILENAPARRYLSLAQTSFDGWLHEQMPEKLSFYNKGEIVAALLDLTLRTSGKSLDDVMRLLWREYGETRRGLPEDGVERAVAAIRGEALARDFFAKYVDGTEPLPYSELFAHAGVAFESAPSEELSLDVGLLPHDEVIAIDGVRTKTKESMDRVFASLREGEAVDVVVSRAGVVSTRTLVARRDPHVTISLRIDGDSALCDWLRRTE